MDAFIVVVFCLMAVVFLVMLDMLKDRVDALEAQLGEIKPPEDTEPIYKRLGNLETKTEEHKERIDDLEDKNGNKEWDRLTLP